jgi:hypothetical protein
MACCIPMYIPICINNTKHIEDIDVNTKFLLVSYYKKLSYGLQNN